MDTFGTSGGGTSLLTCLISVNVCSAEKKGKGNFYTGMAVIPFLDYICSTSASEHSLYIKTSSRENLSIPFMSIVRDKMKLNTPYNGSRTAK